MQLRLTLLDPADPGQRAFEVAIEAPADTPFGRIRHRLESASGASTFSAGGRVIRDGDPLGREPLIRGAIITSCDDLGPVPRTSGVVELSVVGGPGAGSTFSLCRGDHVVGRAASAHVCLDDPDVSRTHAVVSVGPDAVVAKDFEPTNRSTLDDQELPRDGAALTRGSRLRLGSTTLALAGPQTEAPRGLAAGGLVPVHRPPRFVEPSLPVEIHFPAEPVRPDAARAPWLAALAPLVVSTGLALALKSPPMLLFALLSPAMLLGQWWTDRRGGRTSHRRSLRDHRQSVEIAREALRRAVLADAQRRRSEQPDLAAVAAMARARAPDLWQRRQGDGDHLTLRIGTAAQKARVTVTGQPSETVPRIDDVPVAADLTRAGVIGLTGARDTVLSVVGAMIAQLAAWHSPRDVTLRILADTESNARDWSWIAYLPHTGGTKGEPASVPVRGERALADVITELSAQVASRRDTRANTTLQHLPTTVLVLDGASGLRATTGVAELLRDGPAAGVLAICIDGNREGLPVEATAVVDVVGARARLQTVDGVLDGIVPDLPTATWLHDFARLMAPLVDATPQAGAPSIPDVVSFREVHAEAGLDVTSCDGVIASWSSSRRRPVGLVGRGAETPFEIDLVRDGPHALVGGTTGAGKSELLRTLVAGLAVRSRPDDLTFVLIDYKGGSAFGACASLPHVLGVVTDLDESLTRRALTSLEAELRRRERLLASQGASDFAEYVDRAGVCRPDRRLARLVIVVDEFKVLADELPDFVSGLVRIATVGRSLGVHLVLATQRPAGAVSADMRANISLRIALRMRDAADSTDVIDAADAASITDRAPGRALVRGGDGRLLPLQTACVSGPYAGPDSDGPPVRVRLVDASGRAGGDDEADPSPLGSELEAVVQAIREAADRLELVVPPSPWLPALPEIVAADRLPAAEGDTVPVGLADHPALQRQPVHSWDVDRGNLGVAGAPRSGRSTALVAIGLKLAQRYPVDELHLHVLQGAAGPCSVLAHLPHAGTVVDGSDPSLVRRFVQRLAKELDGRHGARRTLVLVDGWEVLEEALSTIDHGATVDELYRIIRDGPRSGLRFVVAGGRSVLSGRLTGLLDDKLLLHLPDPIDLALAGIDPAIGTVARPPGRAIDVRTGLEVQLALPGCGPSIESTRAAVEQAAARDFGVSHVRPWKIEPLPDSVSLTELTELTEMTELTELTQSLQRRGRSAYGSPTVLAPASPDPAPAGLLAVGRGGDDARVVGFIASDGQHRVLVAGAPRMGTTNALTVLATQLIASGRHVVTIARRGSVLHAWGPANGCQGVVPDEASRLADLCTELPDLCLVIDDADRLDGSPIEPLLVERTRNAPGTQGIVFVGADLSRALSSFRGVVPEVARDGIGLILGAVSPTDGDLLGVRLDTTGERRRGRGFIVNDGEAVPVQVALAGRPAASSSMTSTISDSAGSAAISAATALAPLW